MRIYLFYLVFELLCISGTHCSEEDVHSRQKRVIGGSEIDPGMFPWLAHLSATVPTGHWFGIPLGIEGYNCGGSILNERWILTAAHCFTVPGAAEGIQDPSNWVVTVGEVDIKKRYAMNSLWGWISRVLEDPTMRMWSVQAQAIILHPHFDPLDSWENDVALVMLSEPLPVGPEHSEISQVNLPAPELGGSDRHRSIWPVNQRCIVKGWGCIRVGGPVESRARAAVLPIVRSEECLFHPIGPKRICAGYDTLDDFHSFLFRNQNEVGICPGDSGGPLVCEYKGIWLQAGIASYTSATMPGRVPGVFTRVSYYVDWIESAVREYERGLSKEKH